MTVEHRGTSNTNARGSAAARRARKNYLLDVYAAGWAEDPMNPRKLPTTPACRCYRCGKILIYETMEVDRIVPGCKKTPRYPKGGTYARENIRPVCEGCNKITGNIAKAEKAAKRKHRNALARARRDGRRESARRWEVGP